MKRKIILTFRILLFLTITIGIIMNFIAKNYNLNMLFSYYTIQSNILVSFVLILEIINEFKKIKICQSEETYQNIKGATATIILITGLIFTVLLSSYVKNWKGLRLYSSYILHYISPTMFLIDYLFFDQTHQKLKFKKTIMWFIYPITYYLIGIIRIIFLDGFIPYPFMNIKGLGVFKSILIFIILLSVFYLISLLLITAKNILNRKNYKLN